MLEPAGGAVPVLAPAGPLPEPADWAWADIDAWAAERERALTASGRRRAVAATALAGDAVPRDEPVDPGLLKDQRDLELPPWQKGRYGTAVGRAVHGVLQTVDLATGAGLEAAAAAQAAAEGVPDRAAAVEALARVCPRRPRGAGRRRGRRTGGRCTSPAPVGDTLLEGYLDLLYRDADGLVVVDYKTDHLPDEPSLEARLGHYRRQGAAYAAGRRAGHPGARGPVCVRVLRAGGGPGAGGRRTCGSRWPRSMTSSRRSAPLAR